MEGVILQAFTQAISDRLKSMIEHIDHFKRVDIGAELSNWQTADLHRNKPFTMRSRRKGRATTVIRPHSLYEMQRSAAAQRRYVRALPKYEAFVASGKKPRKRKPKYVTFVQMVEQHHSIRPILRKDLLEGLEARMTELMQRKLSWAATRADAAVGRVQDKSREILFRAA